MALLSNLIYPGEKMNMSLVIRSLHQASWLCPASSSPGLPQHSHCAIRSGKPPSVRSLPVDCSGISTYRRKKSTGRQKAAVLHDAARHDQTNDSDGERDVLHRFRDRLFFLLQFRHANLCGVHYVSMRTILLLQNIVLPEDSVGPKCISSLDD